MIDDSHRFGYLQLQFVLSQIKKNNNFLIIKKVLQTKDPRDEQCHTDNKLHYTAL